MLKSWLLFSFCFLTSVSDGSGSHAYVYDALGHMVEETRTIASASAATIAYSYDTAGQITEMVYPSGRIVTYSRDDQGRISDITTKEDALASSVDILTGAAYQPFGPLQSFLHGNGLSLWKTFDTDYWLDQLLLEDVSLSSTIFQRYHTYSDDTNLTNIWDTSSLSGGDQSYWYTAAGKLQNASGSWGDLTFYYDGVGNRTYRILDDGSTTTTEEYGYGGSDNQLDEITVSSVVTRAFTHDAAGNITSENRGGTTYSFTHDARGRLSALSIGGTAKAEHSYDAFERLAIRTTLNQTPSGTVHYIHDTNGHVIAETTSSGTTVREYIWMDDLPVAVVADVDTMSPKLYYVHTDHLMRPIKMTNGAKSIVWAADYLPYGAVDSITGTASMDLRFPGQWFQLEAGLHHNWHRQYDPTTGRYLEPDPLGMPDGPSRWAYVTNNPTQIVDPTGRAIESGWDAVSLGLSTAALLNSNKCDIYFNAAIFTYDLVAAAIPFLPAVGGLVHGAQIGAKAGAKGIGKYIKMPKPIATQKQLGHIKGTAQHSNRAKASEKPTSTFFGKDSGEYLTQKAYEKGTPIPNRPNVKEYDFGVSVGTGPNGGAQTRVRVHRDRSGRIHGHPSGPEKF